MLANAISHNNKTQPLVLLHVCVPMVGRDTDVRSLVQALGTLAQVLHAVTHVC